MWARADRAAHRRASLPRKSHGPTLRTRGPVRPPCTSMTNMNEDYPENLRNNDETGKVLMAPASGNDFGRLCVLA
jgi:hypothetical protein